MLISSRQSERTTKIVIHCFLFTVLLIDFMYLITQFVVMIIVVTATLF